MWHKAFDEIYIIVSNWRYHPASYPRKRLAIYLPSSTLPSPSIREGAFFTSPSLSSPYLFHRSTKGSKIWDTIRRNLKFPRKKRCAEKNHRRIPFRPNGLLSCLRRLAHV